MNLTITNEDTGMEFDELGCPLPVLEQIESAVRARRLTGICYAAGQRFSWSITSPDDVLVELTRNDAVVERIPIPRDKWEAFKALSGRRGVDEVDWLTVLMAQGMRDGIELRQLCHWLFPREEKTYFVSALREHTEEILRFEQAVQEFHGEAA